MQNETYRHVLEEIIAGYLELVKTALATGNLKPYQYKATRDEERGRHDANYINRLRLAVALQYSPNYETQGLEELVRHLLIEEIKDRKDSTYASIGLCLEVLAALLKEYGREEDLALFDEARNANFNCYCSFEAGYPLLKRDLAQMDVDDYIYLALALEEKETAAHLIKLWIDEQKQNWDWQTVNRLCRYEAMRGNFIGELYAQKKRYELVQERDAWDRCLAISEYLTVLLKYNNVSQAKDLLLKTIPILENEFIEWDTISLGQDFMLLAVKLVQQQQEAETIWAWIKPYIESNLGYMTDELYEEAAKAADAMRDRDLELKLKQKLEESHRAVAEIEEAKANG